MGGSRDARLRVGVVGLGRLWEARHRPALARLHDRFAITAVYDQVLRRAELEAQQDGCAVAEGLAALVDRPDVDVIYLMAPQWFGLHALGLACDARKPVYCALPLGGSLAELERLAERVETSGIAFMPELARRFYPATLRLKELLATTLGPPRLVVGHSRLHGFDRYGTPGPTTQMTPAPLLIDPGSFLLDWCGFLFESDPVALQGFERTLIPSDSEGGPSAGPDFECFVAEYPGGGLAQVSFGRYHRTAWGEATRFLPPPGFQVLAERGAAWVELPDRVQWSDSSGTYEERLPPEPTVGDLLNEQFHRLARGEQALAPTFRDALRVARHVADIRLSQREGRRVVREAGEVAWTATRGRPDGDGPRTHG